MRGGLNHERRYGVRTLAILLVVVSTFTATVSAGDRYDYRSSKAYAALDKQQQKNLDQVHYDFVHLWGALDMYAIDNDGQAPAKLADLVPHYLKELPKDPFATEATAKEKDLGQYSPSLRGWGYRYYAGDGDAFVLCSVGLPGFPYLAERGNVDLYIAKGEWTGGRQFVRVKHPK
jgi:hypothetical protein